MGQTERLYRIKSRLDAGRCLHKAALLAELGISPATFKRDLRHLRERMNAPVIFDRERNGWRLDAAA
jgi:predicted DNA-binding transcriptional regulator YafY